LKILTLTSNAIWGQRLSISRSRKVGKWFSCA